MEWHDERMGCVRVSTASVVAGGNSALPSAFSLTVETDYPGDWVCKVVPPIPQGSTGPQNPSGQLQIEEGAIGSRLIRLLPFGALGLTTQLRGCNLSVRVASTTGGSGLIGCSVSPGVVQQRWTVSSTTALPPSAGTDVQLPQLAAMIRVAISGAPATACTVRQEDAQGGIICTYTLAANESREIPLAPTCARIGLVNPDAINAATVIIAALISE